jgi:hypothetical protein
MNPCRRRGAGAIAVGTALLLGGMTLSACAGSDGTRSRPPVATQSLSTPGGDPSQVGDRTAISELASLVVKGRAPRTGYDRNEFGPAWTDDNRAALGHNGCDTRNDILNRDLTAVIYKPGSNNCAVASGELQDPYTGEQITFLRGAATSSDVQIDHVVALSDAWQKGAQKLAPSRRTDLANDPLNLLAVDGPANQRKGDGDAATWLPPNKAYRCPYVARQLMVKARYGLWVTPAEHDAIARVLSTCPGQLVPGDRS